MLHCAYNVKGLLVCKRVDIILIICAQAILARYLLTRDLCLEHRDQLDQMHDICHRYDRATSCVFCEAWALHSIQSNALSIVCGVGDNCDKVNK